jgi:hypothetical protein
MPTTMSVGSRPAASARAPNEAKTTPSTGVAWSACRTSGCGPSGNIGRSSSLALALGDGVPARTALRMRNAPSGTVLDGYRLTICS